MAVTIIKPKIKDVSKIDSTEIITAELVDEFATLSAKLQKKLEKIKPLQNSVTVMEIGIWVAVDEVVDPNQKITLTGNEHELKLGAKGRSNHITNMELAVDLLGEELFLKLANITMKDLKAYLTPEQLEQVTATKYATKRRVKIEKI